jgi:N-acetyl-anhydromuramyl-L-alanine amidase AmpD
MPAHAGESAIERRRLVSRLLLLGCTMATMHAVIGCASDSAARVSSAEFSSTAVRMRQTLAETGSADASLADTATSTIAAPASVPATLVSFRNEFEPEAPPRRWRYIVLHHTATDSGDLAAIDAEHRRRKDRAGNPWLGIGYHFLIGNGQGMADGLVEPTFRWKQQLHGAHAGDRDYNEEGIGICLVGNFDNYPPTPPQVTAARELVRMLAERYDIEPKNIVCHQDVGATRCPGAKFPVEEIIGSKEETNTSRAAETNVSRETAVSSSP